MTKYLDSLREKQIDHIFDPSKNKRAEIISYRKGELIINQDEEVEYLYYIIEGRISVQRDYENGQTKIIKFLKEENLIGDIEIYRTKPSLVSYVCYLDARVIRILQKDIREYIHYDIDLLKYLNYTYFKKIDYLIDHINISVSLPIAGRIAAYILSFLEDDNCLTLPSLTTASKFLGISYRSLTRYLQKFEEDKLIERDREKLRILELDLLRDLTNGIEYNTLNK